MDITLKWVPVLLVALAAMLLMMRLNDIWEEMRRLDTDEQRE
jgi:hypothetical protein